ncbi:MAG TPA: winged helix-turn-helix domain-containing protein [Streptosporangiaceae bacterium]|nr:winged helix-turn-helix domain-containing protein [Streptosporangiaceae bacterium]
MARSRGSCASWPASTWFMRSRDGACSSAPLASRADCDVRGTRGRCARCPVPAAGEHTSGRLAPGRLLPSESTLMGEHGVSRDTVRKAVGLLRDEGLVVTVQGKGSYVADR